MILLRRLSARSVLLVLSTVCLIPAEAQQTLEGERIANIVFEPASQPLGGEELFHLLPLRRGEPYHAADVRLAIEKLYATGRYEDIQVDATVSQAGVLIRMQTKAAWFIGHVTATGEFSEPPGINQIVNASRLRLGEPYDRALLPVAMENVKKLLYDNGYLKAEVESEESFDEMYRSVAIQFRVRAGKRARYAPPKVSEARADTHADTVLMPEDIERASGWKHTFGSKWNTITQTRTTAGIEKIRVRYQTADRVIATVVLRGITASADGRTGTPEVEVDPGPRVDVRTPGARVPTGQLRARVPVFEEHSVDPDLIAEGANGLRDYFQSIGYFDATVGQPSQQVRQQEGGPVTEIDYPVDKGKPHKLTHVGISGNRYFQEPVIRERLLVAPVSFELGRGRYTDAFRKQDVDSIVALYQSNGFRDVKVTTRTEDNYRGKAGDMAVFFEIAEGPQYLVSSLRIDGAEKASPQDLTRSLSSQPGQPFSESNVASDRTAILQYYGDRGFARAAFSWSAKPGPVEHMIDLTFTISEGPQQFVREVVLSGLGATKPRLANRQIELNPGDPLSPSAVAETQKRLADFGVFASVNTAVQDPDGDEERKTVLYDVEEAHKYSFTAAPGAVIARIGGSNAVTDLSSPGGGTGFSPRISATLTRFNLFGRAQSVSFQGAISTLERRALANYYVPRILGQARLDGTFSLLYDDAHDVRTFESRRREASGQIVEHVSKSVTAFYRFSYRNVAASDLKINPLLLPQLAQSVRVGILSFNLVQDRRDDPLDPHRGVYTTLESGVAARAFTSQSSFVRLLGRNATYYRIGPKVVFARETQIGLQPAFSVPANADQSDPIPLPERFFGGGGSSIRAFPENQAGPRDTLTGFPLGGSALFYNSTELRFPLYGLNVNGVLFEDAGNIYSSPGAISFRASQRSMTDFDYMVHAAGFGIRYRTPVGPVRLDFAYSINPPRFNGFPGSYAQLVSCSLAGTCQASPQQISHFQFFFSIGQAF